MTLERVAFGMLLGLAACAGLGDIAQVSPVDVLLLACVRGLLPLVIGLTLLATLLKRRLPAFPSRLAAPALAWLVVLVTSAALAPSNRLDALAALERPASGALLAWAAYDLCRARARWRLLAQAAALGGLGIALIGVAEASGVPGVREWLARVHDGVIPIGDVPRIASTLSHPNEAAMLLELSLPLLVAWAWTAPWPWRVPLALGALSTLVAMVLTFSRAGMVAGMAGLAIMAGLCAVRGERRALASLGAAALAVPAALVCAAMANPGLDRRLTAELTPPPAASIERATGDEPTALNPRPSAGQSPATSGQSPAATGSSAQLNPEASDRTGQSAVLGPEATSLATRAPGLTAATPRVGPQVSRLQFWTAALDMLRDQPLLGVGPDNFRWRFASYSGVPADNLGVHAHDQYLEALANTGVLGLLTLAGLLASLVRTAVLGVRRCQYSADWPWRAAILASLGAWLLHALLDDFERFWPTSVAFWLLAGLNLRLPDRRPQLSPASASAARPARRRKPAMAALSIGVVLIPAACSQSGSSASAYPTISGIPCDTAERVAFHIHAHLAIFAHGQPVTVPYGIGIGDPWQIQQSPEGPFVVSGSCFYWLHTHTEDGVIHIESPVQRTFTLADFFAIWGQPLSTSQVAVAQGSLIAYVNDVRWSGDPNQIPLQAHALIQLDLGQDVPPQPFTFPPGL